MRVFIIKSYDDKVASIDKRKSDLHADIRKERDLADERMYEIDKQIGEINFNVSELQQKSIDIIRERIKAYREGNKSARSKPEPIYFSQSVSIK